MAEPKYTRITPRSYKDDMPMSTRDDKHYPTINLSLKDLPEAKDWKVGETYNVSFKLKQVSKNESKNGGTVTFEICGRHVEDEEDTGEDDNDNEEEDSDDDDEDEDDETEED